MPRTRWFGCAGHLIVAQECQFHLHTRVGDYRVSTIGQYWPDSAVRRITAQFRDYKWWAENARLKGDFFDAAYMKRFGFENIGADRLFETFVFRVTGEGDHGEGEVIEWAEIDSLPANDELTATTNHMRMVRRYQRISAKETRETQQNG